MVLKHLKISEYALNRTEDDDKIMKVEESEFEYRNIII